MTTKNNDDVAHLLDATGRTGMPYRQFESASNHMSAPLIDAVLGNDATPAEREQPPLAVGVSPGNDLLAEVFDRAPGLATAKAPEPRAGRDAAPRSYPAPGMPAPVSASGGPMRSLNDIRRIITQPVDQAATPLSAGGLNGLFDRLAR